MTRLRRLALKISSVVVRRAPENSKEWAQAMSREMQFIPSDLGALRWALGSTRILLERRETRLSSLADVPQAAQRFAAVIRKRTVSGCTICVFESFCFLWLAQRVTNPIQRLGCNLVVGAMLYMALQLLIRRGRLSEKISLPASPEAYRLELARQRDFHRGGWFWSRFFIMTAAFLLFCGGGEAAHPAVGGYFAILGAIVFVFSITAVPLNLLRAQEYQRRIDELNAAQNNEV